MDDLSCFCCLNSGCSEHGKRGAGNLTVSSRYGSQKERRMFRCSVCKARFSETMARGWPRGDGEHLEYSGLLCIVNKKIQ